MLNPNTVNLARDKAGFDEMNGIYEMEGARLLNQENKKIQMNLRKSFLLSWRYLSPAFLPFRKFR